MMAREWTVPFNRFAARLTNERGRTLVALVLREELTAVASTSASGITERWDVLIAGDWVSPENRSKDLNYIVDLFRIVVGATELLRISRFLLMHITDQVVQALIAEIDPRQEITRLAQKNVFLGMLPVREVIIFTPREPSGGGQPKRKGASKQ